MANKGKDQGTYYYHGDHLASSNSVTTRTGTVHEYLDYFPYGETWVQEKASETATSMPYKFTSKELDPETGLYYFGARYLDPRLSRWVSADPVLDKYLPATPINEKAKEYNEKLPGGGGVFASINLDLYNYAGDNPIIFIDPDGMVRKKTLTDYILRLLISEKQWQENFGGEYLDGFARFSDTMIFSSIEVPAELLGDMADYCTIGLIATGNVPGAATSGVISKTADGISLTTKITRALITNESDDWRNASDKAAQMGIKFIISTKIKNKMLDVKVTMGKGGHYYQLGRRGRLSDTAGMWKKLYQDLAPEVGGQTAKELVKKAQEQAKENEKKQKSK